MPNFIRYFAMVLFIALAIVIIAGTVSLHLPFLLVVVYLIGAFVFALLLYGLGYALERLDTIAYAAERSIQSAREREPQTSPLPSGQGNSGYRPAPATPKKTAVKPSVPHQQSRFIACPKCGEDNTRSTHFCIRCGAGISA